MLKRYLKQRDNPWELLAIASLYLLPGVALIMHRGSVAFYNIRHTTMRPTFMSEGAAHVFGGAAVAFAVVLIALYFYARLSSSREESGASESHATEQHSDTAGDVHLAYGSTRSPFPVFDRLRFWRRRS